MVPMFSVGISVDHQATRIHQRLWLRTLKEGALSALEPAPSYPFLFVLFVSVLCSEKLQLLEPPLPKIALWNKSISDKRTKDLNK